MSKITYGVDYGKKDGDKTSLSIVKDNKLFNFTGVDADILIEYSQQLKYDAHIKEARNNANTALDRLLRLDKNYTESFLREYLHCLAPANTTDK